jgi:transcriptional regulator with PAS, ATPase and Fis domain
MKPRQTGDTTFPAPSSRPTDEVLSTMGIRWVFPTEDGAFTEFSKARIVLGRDPGCDARLPGKETSREHAEVVRHGLSHVLRDLASTNAVYVNGLATKHAVLREGDVVRIGEWIGIVAAQAQDAGQGVVYEKFADHLFGGPVLRPLLALTRRAAQSDLPIVIEGETGTGKEGLSRAIHDWSGRKGPFYAVNCAALPDNLAEAELFGYRKGAFTGADRSSLGHFRAAHGGTLLLDEIIDMPLPLQAKLLRVLEQRELLPLGETQPVPVDIRIVAATQVPLSRIAGDKFRVDLAARLEGFVARLPPLRLRKQEIPFLFLRLLEQHAGGPAPRPQAKLIEQLCLYDWPSNVRELELLARRLLVLHGAEPALRRTHLPERMLAQSGSAPLGSAGGGVKTRDERELEALFIELRKNGGVLAQAARAVRISRQRAYRLLEGRASLDAQRDAADDVEAEPDSGVQGPGSTG